MPTLMWVGIIQSTEDPTGTKTWRKGECFLAFLELGCLFSPALGHQSSWFSGFQLLALLPVGPPPSPFLKPLASGLGVTPSAPLVLKHLDSD